MIARREGEDDEDEDDELYGGKKELLNIINRKPCSNESCIIILSGVSLLLFVVAGSKAAKNECHLFLSVLQSS